MRIEEGFQQEPISSDNPYSSDPVLPSLIKRLFPQSIRQEIEDDLTRLGNVLVDEIRPLSPLVHPASLVQYDQWGRRVDALHTSEGWRELEKFAIKEGYVAIAYERKYREFSRIHMFAKTMVMTGDCHVLMCPMGMTDGATRILELCGTDLMKQQILPKLMSRDPSSAYLSGQWMTERPGGSDLSRTETFAVPANRVESDLGTPYILEGFKWFSSAAEGNMTMALARTGELSQGSRGLSLFLVPLRLPPYSSPLSNGVQMHRLKNKVGTHGVPTAELSLNSTRGWLIGPVNQGIKTIAPVLNITRIHSAIHLVGSLQRCVAIARSYATVRSINGGTTLLRDVPLHMASIAEASLLYRALVHVTFGAIELLGKSEVGAASADEEARLRLLTPTIKAYASQKACPAMEEMMGALGGLGYMEEVGIGRLIRDSMVERIWEGTVNILSLDLIRATKEQKTVDSFVKWAKSLITNAAPQFSGRALSTLRGALEKLPSYFKQSILNPLMPRPVLNYFASIACALYLLEHAQWSAGNHEPTRDIDAEAFRRWVEEGDLQMNEQAITVAVKDGGLRVNLNLEMVYGPESPFPSRL